MANSDDITPEYQQHRTLLNGKTEEAAAADFVRQYSTADVGAIRQPGEAEVTPLPSVKPFPTDRKAPPGESTAGKVMRNVGEVPTQAIHGIESAVMNALGPLNGAAKWLDENVADLSYKNLFGGDLSTDKPDTLAGKLTRSLSEYLTGFIPAMKLLQTAGIAAKAGSVGTPMLAGAIADFAARDPHEERLSNLWNEMGLPKNVLTDWMAAEEDDSGLEGRFKGAVEGVLTGTALEGFIQTARATRAAIRVRRAQQSEKDFMKQRYGEVTDEERLRILGDDKRPLLEQITKPLQIGKPVDKQQIWQHQTTAPITDLKDEPMWFSTVGSDFYGMEGKASGKLLAQLDLRNPFVESKATEKDFFSIAEAWKKNGLNPDEQKMFLKDAKSEFGVHMVSGLRKALIELGYDGVIADKSWKTPMAIALRPQSQVRIVGEEGSALGKSEALEKIIGNRGSISVGDMKTYVNFARIDKPDDVKAVIAQMAELHAPQIKEAQRGRISQATTRQMAEDLGMTVEQLLARRKGQPFNAEEGLAARQLLSASAENLLAATKKAAGENAGKLDQFAFRRALATHAAIQNEVMGARTETARALAAWKIPAGSGVDQARAIEVAMREMGGITDSKEMAGKLLTLVESGAPQSAINKFVGQSWGAKSAAVIREVWINGLLSSPPTHLANAAGNTVVAGMSIVERGVAAAIGSLRMSDGQHVAAGEAAAIAHGTLTSLKDAFVYAARAFKSGETQIGTSVFKLDIPTRYRAVSTETFGMASDTSYGRALDFIGDWMVRLPSRSLMASDEFYKTIGYRAEVQALGMRQAQAEGLKGKEAWDRMVQIANDPPENLRIDAVDQAMYRTFNDAPGAVLQAFINFREKIPAAWIVMPFLGAVGKITKHSFERTPLAPMMQSVRADIAAGGARADLALARMATGTAILATTLDFADSGRISGSGASMDKGEREAAMRQGWKPWSIQVNGVWHPYNRLDPIGMMVGFAAESAERIRRGEIQEDDVDEWQEVMAMGVGAIGQSVVSKNYMRGVSDFFAFMSDPTRYGEKYVSNIAASFLPFTALAGSIERMDDPIIREAQTPWDAINAKLIGASDKLSPSRSLWGLERTSAGPYGRAYDFFSPVASSRIAPEPIDTEILRLAPFAAQDNVDGSAPTRIAKRTSFGGVTVNMKEYPQVYDAYVRLAGNELKNPDNGLGAKDFLNAVLAGQVPESKMYKGLSDANRIRFINNVVQRYRKAAQLAIMQDPQFSDFQRHVEETRQLMLLRRQNPEDAQ